MALPACDILDLPGFVLPEAGPHLRDHVRPPERRTAHYLERFDRTTLWYDLVRQETENRYLFTAPPFANLWPLLRDGLSRDGRPVQARLRRQASMILAWLSSSERMRSPGSAKVGYRASLAVQQETKV